MAVVYTVDEFCQAHKISRSLFYLLQAQNKAPQTFTIGAKRLISEQAAQAWLREREAESTKPKRRKAAPIASSGRPKTRAIA